MDDGLPQHGEQWAPAWAAARERRRGRAAAAAADDKDASRVGKLDAGLLDDELAAMIREPVADALALVRPGAAERYRAELDVAIRAALFWLSAGAAARRATYGQGLQNLRYAGRAGLGLRLHVLGALAVGGPYAWARAVGAMARRGWADAAPGSARARLWRLARRAEQLARAAALVNFVAFIATGRFRSVAERALGLRLVHARPQLAHAVSFEFLNRQLVWHAFTEFVLFALPLVSASRARAWVVRRARRLLRLPAADPALAALPAAACAVCRAAPAANPYAAECGHRYCYVCIAARVQAEGSDCACLRCGRGIGRLCRFSEPAP
ncbi:peroxisome assembly protein (Peroxin-2) [Coemansia javaensis]|uniref:RING-type E3 ubiquitin transferase (cysteine targeting) n=1 Tax=Coemansia javaensis TaxID=2761396 RepID=A0A9W8LK44_9FUNG|nr:peroxisome assembly protein (Peroxin-2) [Coemansia javaensis]